jgi:competence protein ComEC
MEWATPSLRSIQSWISRRPAILFTIFLAAGIAFAPALPLHPWPWLTIAAACVIAAAFSSRARSPLLLSATLLIGIAAQQIDRYQFPATTIAQFATNTDRLSTLEISIDRPPRLTVSPPGELRNLPPKQTAVEPIRAVRTTAGWQPAAGLIALTLEQPDASLRPGQIIRATGMLQRPQGAMNPGEFDYAQWCRDQRILATFRVEHADAVEIIRDSGFPPLQWARTKIRNLLASGFDSSQSFNQSLLAAFVFGDPDPRLRDLDDKFVRTGTIHYLAVSGLHVAIVGAIVLVLCRLLRVSPRTSALLALAAVLLYGLLAEPSWPGWRSIILCTVATAGLLTRRATDSLQMLGIAVGLILLIHPADLRAGGFQVSVAAVAGLILLTGWADDRLRLWWRGDHPARRPRAAPPAIAFFRAIGRFIVGTLVASCIAWTASMPLIAYHFGQLNLWSVPAGIVMLPLTIVALAAGLAKIALSLLFPGPSHLWAAASALPVLAMRHIIETVDRLPGASVGIWPPIWMLAVYYGLVILLLVPIRNRATRWFLRAGSLSLCAALLILPSLGGATISPNSAPPQPLRITLLSIGAGQTAVIRPSPDHALFIDAGSSTISDVGREVIEPFLRDQHCWNVDRILLSHGDFDHISAAETLLADYRQPTIYTSPHFARHAVGNVPAESLLSALRASGHPATIIHQGDHLDLADGARIDVLWPPVHCNLNSNDCGLVLKLSFAGKSVLFPADIQVEPERQLLRHPELLRADVLVAPHHGSAEITTAAFIAAVHPKFILASSAEKLTHKQRLFDTLARSYAFYRTADSGAIDLTIHPSGEIQITTFLVARSKR